MKDQLHEPTVVGCLLNMGDRQTIEEVCFVAGLLPTDFSNRELGTVYGFILQAYEENITPNPETIFTLSRQTLPLEWLRELSNTPFLLPEELLSHARMIVRQAEVRETTKTLVGGLEAIQSNRDIDEVRDELMHRLARNRGGETLNSSIAAIFERHKAHRGNLYVTPTHLPWLDDWLKGGLRSRRFIAIAGPQGGRKSTWARNIALYAARDVYKRPRDTVAIAWLAYENDQVISAYDFAAMCAVEWLAENGHWNAKAGSKLIREMMDAESLSYAVEENVLDSWPDLARQAAEVGMERAQSLPIEIYDAGEETGALTNRLAMHRLINSHKWSNEGKHCIYIVDYAQLVRENGRLFEDMEILARDCLHLVRRLNCTLILLSQFNEEYNKDLAKGQAGKGYQGIKGGGDIKAGVHNLMTVEYNDEISPDQLHVKSGKARRGKTTTSKIYTIEPTSGLVLVR